MNQYLPQMEGNMQGGVYNGPSLGTAGGQGQQQPQPGTSGQFQNQWMHQQQQQQQQMQQQHHHQQQQQQSAYHLQQQAFSAGEGTSGLGAPGIHQGHVSPTRSGSISSHGHLMSPPPSQPHSSSSNGGKFHQPKSPAFSGSTKPPKAPEKPLIPYLRFSKSVWESVKKANPGMQFADIGKIIGEQWRNCPADVKQKFSEEYLKDKEKYAQTQKAYLESPEYVEWLNAKSRREAHEEEERKRRENSVSSNVSPPRSGFSQHAGSGASAASDGFQQPHHGPLEELQSMSQRIIPPKISLNPQLTREAAGDMLEDDLDDCLRAKHIASARYRRNHRLLAEVFSEAIVPDGRMIVNEQRMNLLRKQVSSLTHHQDRLIVEQRELVEKHEAKKQKLTEDSGAFQDRFAKIKEECKPVSKEQFQGMIEKYSKILEKQWTDLQAQNLAKQQEASQSPAEVQTSSSDDALESVNQVPAEATSHTETESQEEVVPEKIVEATCAIQNEESEMEVDENLSANTSSELMDDSEVHPSAQNLQADEKEIGDVPSIALKYDVLEPMDVSDIPDEQLAAESSEIQSPEKPTSPVIEFPEPAEQTNSERNSVSPPVISAASEPEIEEVDPSTAVEAIVAPVVEEPDTAPVSVESVTVEPEVADVVTSQEAPVSPEVPENVASPDLQQSSGITAALQDSEVITSDDEAESPGNPKEENQSEEPEKMDVLSGLSENGAEPTVDAPAVTVVDHDEDQISNPGSVQQTLQDMVLSVSASENEQNGKDAVGNYADYAL